MPNLLKNNTGGTFVQYIPACIFQHTPTPPLGGFGVGVVLSYKIVAAFWHEICGVVQKQ